MSSSYIIFFSSTLFKKNIYILWFFMYFKKSNVGIGFGLDSKTRLDSGPTRPNNESVECERKN